MVRVPAELRQLDLDPLRLAVDGGEDYELLFTVPKRLCRRVPPKIGSVPVTVIGEITRGRGLALIDLGGRAVPLPSRGWDPFCKPGSR